MGLLDDLEKGFRTQAIINAAKKSNGKPDPYAALGAAMGSGKFSSDDIVRLGVMLGAQGAFDKDKKK